MEVDTLPIPAQRLASLLPYCVPFRWARKGLLALSPEALPRTEYLKSMKLEVLWLNRHHLRHCFVHHGTEHIDPGATYIFTSIHYGHWGMYPASLYQQQGIASQMVASGRNRTSNRTTPQGHFWYRYGHRRMSLSGFPACYSTDGIHAHLQRLRDGRNLTIVLDVRERGFTSKQDRLNFLGHPYYLPRSVPLLARRAKVSILPYIGRFRPDKGIHEIHWLPAIQPNRTPVAVLQQILDQMESFVSVSPHDYFNHWEQMQVPHRG